MNIVEINNIKKTFDGVTVLNDITVRVKEGEVVSIIGSSGSGKSTLLRCATLLETMDQGELKYLDEYVARTVDGKIQYESKEKIKKVQQYFGLVFQNFNLFPHWNVLKNVMDAPLYVQMRDKYEVEQTAIELLKTMGLEDKIKSYPDQLSGGQKQRVAIARALALQPKMLYFDEPTSALDPELTGEILKVIKELAEKKMTMVIVTHEMSFARDVSDRIIFMDKGYIVEEGNAYDVITNPKEERTKQFLSNFANN